MEVASRELRNNTRDLLRRAEAGEDILITVGGRPAAVLCPPAGRRWVPRDEFVRRIAPRQADPSLAQDLHDLAPDTTDDLDEL